MKSHLNSVFAAILIAGCGTEPAQIDPAIGSYGLVTLYDTRTALPAGVHIESSGTEVRYRLDIFADTLRLLADGTWEERTVWRTVDHPETAASVSFQTTKSAGTFSRNAEGQLTLMPSSTDGFLWSVGAPRPAPVIFQSDTLLVPNVTFAVVWDPRYRRVP